MHLLHHYCAYVIPHNLDQEPTRQDGHVRHAVNLGNDWLIETHTTSLIQKCFI